MQLAAEKINPQIEESWKLQLQKEFESSYFIHLKRFLIKEKQQQLIYPPGGDIFNAFNLTALDNVRVVILGQDPYHGEGQAHGLCFSVKTGIKTPPSLVNIFKELVNDVGINNPKTGNLEAWAQQGVLLLNATLTVRAGQAGSHQGKGWEQFTDAAIKKLSDERAGLIFLLWGRFAQAKETLINTNKHHILKAAHPSPFSAHNGFFGCRHFSKTNALLIKQDVQPINWQIE